MTLLECMVKQQQCFQSLHNVKDSKFCNERGALEGLWEAVSDVATGPLMPKGSETKLRHSHSPKLLRLVWRGLLCGVKEDRISAQIEVGPFPFFWMAILKLYYLPEDGPCRTELMTHFQFYQAADTSIVLLCPGSGR